MKIHRTLFVRKNVPILAVLLALLGFFGIRFSVKSVIYGHRVDANSTP